MAWEQIKSQCKGCQNDVSTNDDAQRQANREDDRKKTGERSAAQILKTETKRLSVTRSKDG